MAKIKKIGFGDLINIKKLMSVVCSDNILNYRRLFLGSVPITYLQNLFYSVHFRKFPETYVVSDNNNNLKGLITVKAIWGNPYKWQIKRLFLDKNSHEEGKQLIEYIIAKFGARGVDTFSVSVNDNQNEMIDLFVKGCGFRFCSTESFWSVSNINFLTENIDESQFKNFKNSDAKRCIDFYNENINSLYKYSLSREKEELYDKFAQGLHSDTSFKYIVEDNDSKNIKAVIKILTFDNKNYIFDYVISQGYADMFPMILSFAVKKITKRNKNFKLYVKNRKYLNSGEQLENFFKDNRFELLQNNAILVRDFFKNIKQESSLMNSAIVFSGFEV